MILLRKIALARALSCAFGAASSFWANSFGICGSERGKILRIFQRFSSKIASLGLLAFGQERSSSDRTGIFPSEKSENFLEKFYFWDKLCLGPFLLFLEEKRNFLRKFQKFLRNFSMKTRCFFSDFWHAFSSLLNLGGNFLKNFFCEKIFSRRKA